MLDSPECVCAGQACSNIQLLPFSLVIGLCQVGARGGPVRRSHRGAGRWHSGQAPAYLIAAVPFTFTFATTAWLAGRWLSDRFKDGDYGQLLRVVDPDEFEMGYPYQLIAMVGFIGTAWCIFAAIVIDGVTNRTIQGAIYAVALGFVTWSLAGVISLARISFCHQQRAARMRAMKEELEAAARQAKSERDAATEE